VLKWVSRIFRGLIGVAAVVVALGIFGALRATAPEPERSGDSARALVVEAVQASRVPVGIVFEGYGTARAMRSANVSAEVAGRVMERPESIEPGRAIGAGETIVRIDPGDYGARVSALRALAESIRAEIDGLEVEEANLREQVTSAEGELEVSRRELERAREAEDRGAGNRSETDQRVRTVRQAERSLSTLRNQLELVPTRRASLRASLASRRAELTEAELNLERSTVVSPIDGTLQRVGPRAGDFVRVGDEVARVVDLSVIEVPVRLPVSATGKVRVSDPVELRAEGNGSAAWRGTVARLSPEADERSRSIEVFVEVRQDPSSADRLTPGRFLLARVTDEATEPRLVTPRRTVDGGTVLVGRPLDVDSAIAAELARFDERLGLMPPRDADAVREAVGGDEAARRAWLLENDRRLMRLVSAARPSRVTEAQVIVDRYVDGTLDAEPAGESQWAVLADESASVRGLEPGAFVLLSNLDQLRVGMEIDVRLPGEDVTPAGETGVAEATPDWAPTGG